MTVPNCDVRRVAVVGAERLRAAIYKQNGKLGAVRGATAHIWRIDATKQTLLIFGSVRQKARMPRQQRQPRLSAFSKTLGISPTNFPGPSYNWMGGLRGARLSLP